MQDLGREHWVVYVQTANKDDVQKAGRTSEMDPLFARFIRFASKAVEAEDNTTRAKLRYWSEAQRLGTVDLAARLLTLARLHREVGAVLTPFDFIQQQTCGAQPFAVQAEDELASLSETALEAVVRSTLARLAPLVTQQRRLVIVLDEIEAGSRILPGHFQRDVDQTRLEQGPAFTVRRSGERIGWTWYSGPSCSWARARARIGWRVSTRTWARRARTCSTPRRSRTFRWRPQRT